MAGLMPIPRISIGICSNTWCRCWNIKALHLTKTSMDSHSHQPRAVAQLAEESTPGYFFTQQVYPPWNQQRLRTWKWMVGRWFISFLGEISAYFQVITVSCREYIRFILRDSGQGCLRNTLEWIPPLESIAKNQLEPWKLQGVSFFSCFSQFFLYVGSSRTFGFLGLRVGNPIPSLGLVYLPTFGWFLV